MEFNYEIKAANHGPQAKGRAKRETEVLIFGDIGGWDDLSVKAAEFVRDFAALKDERITIRINSVGGSVVDGLAIYNAIRRHPATVTVAIEGLAASIASLIAMAGDTVTMAANALLMIHAPWMLAAGNAKSLREQADTLDHHARAMAQSYAGKTGMTADEVMSQWLNGEDHWFSADEALAAGLADEITEAMAVAAQFDISRFNPPQGKNIMTKNAKPTGVDAAVEGVSRDQVAAEVLAAETERRNEIAASFKFFMDHEGVNALCHACESDPKVSVAEARNKLLALLGSSAEPVGGFVHVDEYGHSQNPISSRITVGNNSHHGEYRAAAVDALLMRRGLAVQKPHPAARDLMGLSAMDHAKTIVSQQGRTFRGTGPNEVIRAAMTTSDFPSLLADTAHKALMMGYEDAPASHRIWTRQTEAEDFKTKTVVALSGAPALEVIGEAGEYKAGALSDRAVASYALETYGKMLIITRKAIINDDLDGFTRIPQAFGGSAARLEADKVYALLTSNPDMNDGTALFHADHGNLMTGTALSVSSLGAARAAMRKQKDASGVGILNVVPRYLIVPAALETLAEQLLSSLVDPDQTNDTNNPGWIRGLDMVVDPRLDAVSETGWYLASHHSQIDTVEIAHLSGQRGVFTEDENEFVTDNYRIKARLDFAAQVIDWVGLVHNPGA